MSTKDMWCKLVIILLMLGVAATTVIINGRTSLAGSIMENSNLPPGKAMDLSIRQARAQLKEAIQNKYVGTAKSCRLAEGFQGLIGNKLCDGRVVFGEVADVRVSTTGLYFTASYTETVAARTENRYDVQVPVSFRKVTKYVQAYSLDPTFSNGVYQLETPKSLFSVGTPDPWPSNYPILIWADKTSAENFADALNRLLYAARQDKDFATFSAAAKPWRKMPVKPALPEGVQKYRVMAEDAFKNKEFEKAADYYEQGLEIEPLWPQGQYNAALLYGEIKDYENAVLHMKRYLELVPDARNAETVREKIYLWEGKANEEMQKVTGAGM